jgi:hypothetical protein
MGYRSATPHLKAGRPMRFAIFAWVVLAIAAAGGAWFAMQPARRGPAWFWTAVCAVLLAAFAASFVLLGDSADKTFLSLALYFLNWGMAAGGAAICAGVIAGLSAALAFKR